MSDRISISGLRGFGYHGVLEHEKINGQEFIIHIVIDSDFTKAIESDKVSDTVNYAEVAQIGVSAITDTRFDLIESLADFVARKVRELPGVQGVEVTVEKPSAPIDVAFGSVSVTRVLR